MALTLISAPAEFLTSKNPIAFVMGRVEADEFTKVTCAVFMETEYGLADWQFVHDESRTFDSDNRAVFQIQTVLDAELERTAHYLLTDYRVRFDGSQSDAMPNQNLACRRYVVVFKPGIPEVLSISDYELIVQDKFVLKAHLPHSDFTPAGNFYDKNSVQSRLLSHKPKERAHYPGQLEFIWLSAFSTSLQNQTAYTWGLIDSNGVEQVAETVLHPATLSKHLPFAIPAHKIFNYALATSPDMGGVWIETLEQKIRLMRDFEELEYVREFHFNNILGGFDSLITYGKAQKEEKIAFDESQKFLPHTYTATDFQFQRHNVVGRTTIKATAGYRTKAERDAAKALLYSEQAFERKNGKIQPIVLGTKSIKNNPDGDFRFGLEFEYEYAFEQYGTV
jgi:hypothetical protein